MEFEERARLSEAEGDFLSAIKFYSQALNELKRMNLIEGLQFDLAHILNRLANLYTEIGNYDVAIEYFHRASESYLASDEPLTKVYRLLGECHSNIGACYLTSSDYKLAFDNFQKAATSFKKAAELEDPILRKYVVERIIFSFALVILCLIKQEKKFSEILPIAKKTITLSKDFKLTGFAVNLSMFFYELLNKKFAEAHLILQERLEDAADSTLLPSALQATVMGKIMDLASKYIPEAKIRVQGRIIEEKGEVIFSTKILQDMLLYSLPYANETLPRTQWKEVMALIVGKIEGDDVLISEVVPMTSGSEVEVAFKEETYSKAAIIDSIASERNEFIVGWFHTHPGLGLFLSPTDIMNHLGYQSLNPKAIAIVFDCTQMSPEKLGFEIFRLDDPSLGEASNFHAVHWRILDAPHYSEIAFYSFFEKFLSKLKNLIYRKGQLSLSQLATISKRSEDLLNEIIPRLLEIEYLPNIKFDQKNRKLLAK